MGEELKKHGLLEGRVRRRGTTGQERGAKPTKGNEKVSWQSSGGKWKRKRKWYINSNHILRVRLE